MIKRQRKQEMGLWERKCADCGNVLIQQDIDRPQRSGYPYFPEYCIQCAIKHQKAWKSKRNKNLYQRLKVDEDKLTSHRKRLQGNSHMRHFGISLEEYEARLEAQNRVCACCGQPETFIDKRSGLPKSLAVDHCHATGQIRALLCSACNYSFGLLEESPERIRLLLAYAEKVKSNQR